MMKTFLLLLTITHLSNCFPQYRVKLPQIEDLAAEPDKYGKVLLHLAEHVLDFSTGGRELLFWVGLNQKIAEEWAESTGKITLRETQGGEYLNALDLFNDNVPGQPTYKHGLPLPVEVSAKIWNIASRRFSEMAKGNVYAFLSQTTKIRPSSMTLRTWYEVELPTLLKNGNVQNIYRMEKVNKRREEQKIARKSHWRKRSRIARQHALLKGMKEE